MSDLSKSIFYYHPLDLSSMKEINPLNYLLIKAEAIIDKYPKKEWKWKALYGSKEDFLRNLEIFLRSFTPNQLEFRYRIKELYDSKIIGSMIPTICALSFLEDQIENKSGWEILENYRFNKILDMSAKIDRKKLIEWKNNLFQALNERN